MVSSKKAQAGLEILLVIILLFGLGIVAVIGNKMFSDLNTELQADDSLSNESKAFVATVEANYPSTFDTVFLLALIFLWVLLIVSSFLIDTHPVFFVVTLVILVMCFVISMLIANTYEEFSDDTSFSTYAAEFPITSWVMSHLLIVIIVMGFTVGVTLYAKNQL